MNLSGSDTTFAGAIPRLYEQYLVPLLFAPYAIDLASRVASLNPGRVLEIAAGTGAVTRELAQALPPSVPIVASDLNRAMLAQAAAMGTVRPVDWQPADAMQLPFADAAFDVVVCQFGAMFFPDKAHAFAEARRVLRPGGRFVFSVWDSLDHNEFAAVVTDALAALFPNDPPRFMARTPHGYYDVPVIRDDLARGGWTSVADIVTMPARSRAASARIAAVAYCHGTPLRNEIEARDAGALAAATDAAEQAIAARFGAGAVDGKMQAHIIAIGG